MSNESNPKKRNVKFDIKTDAYDDESDQDVQTKSEKKPLIPSFSNNKSGLNGDYNMVYKFQK